MRGRDPPVVLLPFLRIQSLLLFCLLAQLLDSLCHHSCGFVGQINFQSGTRGRRGKRRNRGKGGRRERKNRKLSPHVDRSMDHIPTLFLSFLPRPLRHDTCPIGSAGNVFEVPSCI